MKKYLKLLILSIIGYTSLCGAQTFEKYGPLDIATIEQISISDGPQSYTSRKFLVQNPDNKKHLLTLKIPAHGSHGSGSYFINSLTKNVMVPANNRISFELVTPSLPMAYGNGMVLIDGSTVENSTLSFGDNRRWYHHRGQRYVLKESSINIDSGKINVKHSSNLKIGELTREVHHWPANWQAYSGYPVVIVQADSFNKLTETVKESLVKYVQSGGSLFVLNGHGIEHSEFAKRSENSVGSLVKIGLGKVFLCKDSQLNEELYNSIKLETVNSLRNEFVIKRQTKEQSDRIFNVVENYVPTGSLSLGMLAFVILVGPVSLIWLGKKNRRIWYLWLAPTASVVFAIILAFIGYASEGFTPSIRMSSVTVLNQQNQRALTYSIQGIYAPVSPSEEIAYDSDAELQLQVTTTRHYRSSQQPLSMDVTESQKLTGGWVIPRVPTHFKVIKPEKRRERLVVSFDDGKLTVTNGLGADIAKLYVCDSDGRIAVIDNLYAGDKKSSDKTVERKTVLENWKEEFFKSDWVLEEKDLDLVGRSCKPGTYLAVIKDESPFMQAPLKKANKNIISVVHGIFL